MLVHEIMTTNVHSVGPDTKIEDALHMLTSKGITCVPVVVDDGEVVGIVSEADLIRVMVTSDPRAHLIPVPAPAQPRQLVRDVMTENPYVSRANADIGDLSLVMARHGWKSVPVVRGTHLVGMVSRSDVLRALGRPDAEIRDELLSVLSEFGHPNWQVSVADGEARITGPATSEEQAVASAAALSTSGVRRVTTTNHDGDGRSDARTT